MGYDIYTVDKDTKAATKHAEKYGYSYMFNDKGEYDGSSHVYFRSNIWGMAPLREAIYQIGLAAGVSEDKYLTLVEKLSFNQGDVITVEEIEMFLNDMAKLSPTQYDKIYDVIGGKPHHMDEWIDFLSKAVELNGAVVW